MPESKHTPGPWVTWLSGSPEQKQMSPRGSEPGWKVYGAPREDGSYYAALCTVSEESDAFLIAAAPELLKACHEALRYITALGSADGDYVLDDVHTEGSGSNLIAKKLGAAIARAEGRK